MAVNIKLYNTLTRGQEDFEPIQKNQVGLYSCGPTVYQYPHIGNLRTMLLSDLVRRVFEYNDYAVKQVINITDVGHLVEDEQDGEDKIEKESRIEQKSAQEIADFYLAAFMEDLRQLNIKTENTNFPKATEHIQEQIDLIKKLEDKGFTYKTSDGIYFDTTKYDKYAELAGLDLEGMREGARVSANPEKRSPTDFALWKFTPINQKRQQEWPSPWGVGFPGWHIECSAMSMKYLGNHFDIHTGGADLLPVHHTNERAQSECATGEPFVNYWLHGAFILIDGEKMSKSLGNVYRLADLEQKSFSPLAYRFWLLGTSYRKIANFTWEALSGAKSALDKLINRLAEIKSSSKELGQISVAWQEKFLAEINDDLNLPNALAVVWEMLKDTEVSPADQLATILDFDRVLGLNLAEQIEQINIKIPAEVQELVSEREDARKNKDYSRSDEIRQEINRLGYTVDDTDKGPKIRKV